MITIDVCIGTLYMHDVTVNMMVMIMNQQEVIMKSDNEFADNDNMTNVGIFQLLAK